MRTKLLTLCLTLLAALTARAADLALYAKAALAAELGIRVSFCGTKADGSAF